MMVQRKQIRFWLIEAFLVCFCSMLAGQEKDTGNDWAELLSKSVERATSEFIQIPTSEHFLI